jgi:hypothetical protein
VLLLPYLEANAFMDEYDCSNCWNSEANLDLVAGTRTYDRLKFPTPSDVGDIYQAAGTKDPNTEIFCLLLPDDPKKHQGGAFLPRANGWMEIPVNEESEEMLLVHVAGLKVHWMEPCDVYMGQTDAGKPWLRDVELSQILCAVLVTPTSVREVPLKELTRRRDNKVSGWNGTVAK